MQQETEQVKTKSTRRAFTHVNSLAGMEKLPQTQLILLNMFKVLTLLWESWGNKTCMPLSLLLPEHALVRMLGKPIHRPPMCLPKPAQLGHTAPSPQPFKTEPKELVRSRT